MLTKLHTINHGPALNAWRGDVRVVSTSIRSIESFDGCPTQCEYGYQPKLNQAQAHSAGKG